MSLDNVTGPDQERPNLGTPRRGAILTITPAAAARIKHLLAQDPSQPEAIFVSVNNKGCSGMSYAVEYCHRLADKPKLANTVTEHGVTVVIDPKAEMFIIGSEMDYAEGRLQSGFQFKNPNEAGRCGCGESFTVDPALKKN